MAITVTPIPSTIELAAPGFTLGASNSAGSALTAVASDSTIATWAVPNLVLTVSNAAGTAATGIRSDASVLVYDTSDPTTIGYGASAAPGSQSTSARRDHVHGMAASDAVAQATEAQAKAEDDLNVYVPPDLIRSVPGVAKTYGVAESTGSIKTGSYNVAGVTRSSTGHYEWAWAEDFADANYTLAGMGEISVHGAVMIICHERAVDDCQIHMYDKDGALADEDHMVVGFGAQ